MTTTVSRRFNPLGRDADAAEFDARAKSDRNHWDPETKFVRAKRRRR